MKARKWYKINNKADDVAEISIFGDIGASWWGDAVEAAQFKKDFDEIKKAKSINVIINSPGGDVFDGIAIYNIIATERQKVSVEIMGLAASAASIIALAGSKLTMNEGSFFMIHNAWGFAVGTAAEMRTMADTLDKISGELINIYESHSDLSAEAIKEYMDAETWFTASEAVNAGFADAISDVEEIAASAFRFDVRKYSYAHIPETIAAGSGEIELPLTAREFEGFLRDAGFPKSKAVEITNHGFDAARPGEPDPAEAIKGDPDLPEVESKHAPDFALQIRMREHAKKAKKMEASK